MSDDLIKELRSYPRHYEAAHKAADALEQANRHANAREYYNTRLEDALVKLELREERLREALTTVLEWHGYGLPDETTKIIRAALAKQEEK